MRGGYGLAEIRAMTLADATATFRRWLKLPPLYDLVAGFVGFKPKAAAPASEAQHPSVAMIKAMYPDGMIRG